MVAVVGGSRGRPALTLRPRSLRGPACGYNDGRSRAVYLKRAAADREPGGTEGE
jgi:hypothetical protein